MLNKIVHIKPEFCSNPKESEIDFAVIEDNGDRVLIEPVFWKWHIKPQEMINKEYLTVIK